MIYPPSTTASSPGYTAPETAAPVTINQNVQPQVEFLIALKSGTVKTAVAYWVENDTLHYIDPHGNTVAVPMSQVDRQRSRDLNSGRGVTFGLPDTSGARSG